VEIRPDLAKGYARRGNVYAFLGNFSKAQEEYEKAMQRDSLNPEIHHGLARLQMNTGRENEAEQLLRFSLEKHPGYRNNRCLLARLYHYRFVKYFRQRGKVREDLLHKATEVLKQEKGYYRADMIKADIFLTVYSLREKLSDLKRNRMVEIFDVTGFKAFRQKASQWFQHAVSRDPLSARANFGIARCHAFNGHTDKAMDHLMEYSGKAPGDPRPFYAMGRIYAGQGKWKAARKKWRTAIEHDRRYFPAYYMMMVSYRQQERGKDGWLRSLIKGDGNSGRQVLEKARKVFHSPVFREGADLFTYFTVRYF
jgi:tetratricopeptide (TPR) repeat protein